MCGYSAPPPPKQPKTKKIKPPRTKEHTKTEPIPFWTYVAAFFALFVVIALLSYFITR
jgi:hypothetical protein